MRQQAWIEEFPLAITVMDCQGTILEMNRQSVAAFAKDGGMELIGKNGLECHPESARAKLQAMLQAPNSNLYTIEKDGAKKLIAQIPWYQEGRFSGIVELSIPMPEEVPHFVRS